MLSDFVQHQQCGEYIHVDEWSEHTTSCYGPGETIVTYFINSDGDLQLVTDGENARCERCGYPERHRIFAPPYRVESKTADGCPSCETSRMVEPDKDACPMVSDNGPTFEEFVADNADWHGSQPADQWCEHHESEGSCPVYGCAHHSSVSVMEQAFTAGDRVTHLNFGGNTDVVYGHVTEHDESEQKTQVKWADGSGPTWHLTRALMLIDTHPTD